MKTTSLKLSALASALLLAGCGGGGSSSTGTIEQTSKITGTVPGTLIEAFCEDGSYYSVNSTDDHSDEHPFEIEIPNNISCSLVMTTNENDPDNRIITLIGFTNGSTIMLSDDIDLVHIPLEIEYDDVEDEYGEHVVD